MTPDTRSLAPDTRPMIHLESLEKSFPQGNGKVFVLRQISLDVAQGDFVTIMGPSGAGNGL